MKNSKNMVASLTAIALSIAVCSLSIASAATPDHQDYSEPEPWYDPLFPCENCGQILDEHPIPDTDLSDIVPPTQELCGSCLDDPPESEGDDDDEG